MRRLKDKFLLKTPVLLNTKTLTRPKYLIADFDKANIIHFFTNQGTLMRRSTVLSPPPLPVIVP
jgi:hypothetical protein